VLRCHANVLKLPYLQVLFGFQVGWELQIKQRSNCTKFSIIYFMFAMGLSVAATIRVGNQKA
jgi:hypothetical protein